MGQRKTESLIMKYLLIGAASILALTACQAADNSSAKTPAAASQEQDVNLRLDAWFESKFMEGIRFYPEYMAQLGIKERRDEWNDPSRAFADAQLARTRADMAELQASFNPEDLDTDRALSYRLFLEAGQKEIEAARWFDYDYKFNQMFGTHSSIPTFLINNHPVATQQDAKNYITRLEGIKAYLGAEIENSKTSAAREIMPPKFVYAHVIRTARNILSGAPFDQSGEPNLMLADFEKKVKKLELSQAQETELIEAATQALTDYVGPAYESLITEMQRQEKIAATDDGVWKLPDGSGYYAHRLKHITTTDMSADEIHTLGLSEVARIHAEMRAIMKQVGYAGSLQEFFKYLQTDPQFLFEDSGAGRDAYLKEATALIDTMKSRLDEVFLTKPKAELEVRRVEAFREKAAGKAFYNRPAADGSRPGYYYANLYKISDMPKYQMEALAYHEGLPGHHMQIAIAQELKSIPKFRKFGGQTAYIEGWGLYSEYLPKEMGLYADPYSDFGRLSMELWRAVRLVVDTGLHHKKWTRQEVIDYHVANTPNPLNDITKATERYVVMPGQATAYKIGMIKIQQLRAKAKAELGTRFDIRKFHDVILANGSVPLTVLGELVDEWIASED